MSRMLYFFYTLIMVTSCAVSYEVDSVKESGQDITAAQIEDDQELESIISPYRAQLEKEMNTVLCTNENPMVRDRPESELGNFVSDLCLERARQMTDEPIDCAIFNYGGLRTQLPKGEITRGKIFELMPFDNEMVVVEIPSSGMQEMMQYLAFTRGEPVSDIELLIKEGEVLSAKVQGLELSDRNYRVLTSDYLARGGDKMTFLTEEKRVGIQKLGLKIRDAIIDKCTSLGEQEEKINTQLDGRISIEE